MRKYFFIGIASLSILFTSCLKDKNVDDRVYGMRGVDEGKIIELAVDGHFILYALDYKNEDIMVDVLEVRLAADQPASEDITVELSLDNSVAIIDDYNAANGTGLVQFPLNFYILPGGLTATIPAGSRSVFLKLGLNTSLFDPTTTYALGFRIKSVNKSAYTISGNFGEAIVAFAAKNQYDGRYTLNGAFYHPASSPGYDAFTIDVEMHTTGPNSVKMYVPDFGGYYHPGLFNGAFNAFGAQEPDYTIDPVTNKVTVQNSYVGAVTFYTMAPGFDSHYDPATGTIYAKFGYNYAAGPVFDPATNREWTDELIYLGPR